MNTTLKFPERNLVIIADSMEECVGGLLIWKEAIKEGKCRKDKSYNLCYRPGPPAEFM